MIIGITGPICAGKDEVGRMLSEMGFEKLSLVEELRAEARAQGIEITRTSLQDLGDKMRRDEGVDVLAKRVMRKVVEGKDFFIESIRNPGEVEALRKLEGFVLLCVGAPDSVRFERMRSRAREQDPITFEDFLKLEARDRGIGQPEYGQQQEQCWALADSVIMNDSSLHALREKLREFLNAQRALPKEIIQVITTLPSDLAARELARHVLESRNAACVQILPVESLFWWNGKMQEVREWMCLIKGMDFAKLESAIREKHPYEVPEIVQLPAHKGNADYVRWLRQETLVA